MVQKNPSHQLLSIGFTLLTIGTICWAIYELFYDFLLSNLRPIVLNIGMVCVFLGFFLTLFAAIIIIVNRKMKKENEN
jgi:hypothetical protein